MKKISSKVLAIICFSVAFLYFLGSMLVMIDTGAPGNFLNGIVRVGVLVLLGLFILKEDKAKTLLMIFLALGSFLFVQFGMTIDAFISLKDFGDDGLFITYLIFLGLAALATFFGVVLHFVSRVFDKLNCDLLNLITTICYFAAIGLLFVQSVLGLFLNYGYDAGVYKAGLFIGTLADMGALFILATHVNKE